MKGLNLVYKANSKDLAESKLLDLEEKRAKKGQELSILIETIVREDHIHLYGFLFEIEKTWFNELCKVSGVGNRVALKILGSLSIDEITLALNSGDKALFARVPGIGPKLALRIVSELKDSAKKIGGSSSDFPTNKHLDRVESMNSNAILPDAISALENLGYKRVEIYPIVNKQVTENPNITLETLITNSLRMISKK